MVRGTTKFFNTRVGFKIPVGKVFQSLLVGLVRFWVRLSHGWVKISLRACMSKYRKQRSYLICYSCLREPDDTKIFSMK